MTRRSRLAFLAGLVASLALGWLGLPHLLYSRVEQPLAFSHKVHTSETVGLSCEDCHAIRADGSFTGIPTLTSCAGCHAEAQGQSAAEGRLIAEYVAPNREIPWRVYARQPDNAYFPHAAHVKRAGIACERCHGAHGESQALRPHETDRVSGYSRDVSGPSLVRVADQPWQGMKMSDCEACHAERGRGATACLDCHK